MSRIRVAIADDHPIVREGLQRIVNACADLEVIAEVASGDDVVDTCVDLRPDVLLLDISMPGPGFLEVLRQLGQTDAGTAVLVLSMHPEETFASRALEAGAAGYLNKQRSVDALADAIRAVASGRTFFDGTVATRPAAEARYASQAAPESRLSPREFQIFLLLGSGMRVTEIASRLDLSPKTISTHRARILEKTRLKSNAAIVRYVAGQGLLD